MSNEPRILSTPVEIGAFCERLGKGSELAIDTEFHGEKSYWPKLMLLQIATREEVVIIDPLAAGMGKGELKQLMEAFRANDVLVVGHAVGNDLDILLRITETLPTRVFDTQVAAAFVGLGHQAGLARLLAARLGVDAEKRYSMADWSRRPLPPEQLEYAAADVRDLLALADNLRKELSDRGRTEWVEEECRGLLDPEFYDSRNPERAWRSVRKGPRPGTREALTLRELAAERERIARELDRPRQYVLPDELLVDLARRAPRGARDLQGDTNRRSSPGLQLHAARWFQAVRRAESAPLDRTAPQPPTLSPSQEGLVALARMLVVWQANQADVAPPLVMSFLDELPSLLRTPPIDRAELLTKLDLRGWRASLVGEPLWDLLSGTLHASVEKSADGLALVWRRAGN